MIFLPGDDNSVGLHIYGVCQHNHLHTRLKKMKKMWGTISITKAQSDNWLLSTQQCSLGPTYFDHDPNSSPL